MPPAAASVEATPITSEERRIWELIPVCGWDERGLRPLIGDWCNNAQCVEKELSTGWNNYRLIRPILNISSGINGNDKIHIPLVLQNGTFWRSLPMHNSLQQKMKRQFMPLAWVRFWRFDTVSDGPLMAAKGLGRQRYLPLFLWGHLKFLELKVQRRIDWRWEDWEVGWIKLSSFSGRISLIEWKEQGRWMAIESLNTKAIISSLSFGQIGWINLIDAISPFQTCMR